MVQFSEGVSYVLALAGCVCHAYKDPFFLVNIPTRFVGLTGAAANPDSPENKSRFPSAQNQICHTRATIKLFGMWLYPSPVLSPLSEFFETISQYKIIFLYPHFDIRTTKLISWAHKTLSQRSKLPSWTLELFSQIECLKMRRLVALLHRSFAHSSN